MWLLIPWTFLQCGTWCAVCEDGISVPHCGPERCHYRINVLHRPIYLHTPLPRQKHFNMRDAVVFCLLSLKWLVERPVEKAYPPFNIGQPRPSPKPSLHFQHVYVIRIFPWHDEMSVCLSFETQIEFMKLQKLCTERARGFTTNPPPSLSPLLTYGSTFDQRDVEKTFGLSFKIETMRSMFMKRHRRLQTRWVCNHTKYTWPHVVTDVDNPLPAWNPLPPFVCVCV